jgi:hypothetical protein
MKYFIFFQLFYILVIPSVKSEDRDSLTLSLPSITACSGDTISVPLYVENFYNVGSIGLKISFNKNHLIFFGIKNINSAFTDLMSNVVGNTLIIAWSATNNPVNIGNDKLFEIDFFISKPGLYDLTFLPQCEIMNIKTLKPFKLVLNDASVTGYENINITGKVTYNNYSLTPLSDINVFIYNSRNVKIDSAKTDINGVYEFRNVVCGKYVIKAESDMQAAGITPLDALLANKIFLQLYAIKDIIKYKAADVNASNNINPLDAFLINKKYTELLDSFSAGNWYFEETVVQVQGAEVNVDIKGICIGDVDASYTP